MKICLITLCRLHNFQKKRYDNPDHNLTDHESNKIKRVETKFKKNNHLTIMNKVNSKKECE